MSRRCRGCGHVLRRPSPDGLGPVCRTRLASHTDPTPRTTPVAPAAGQIALEEPMTDQHSLNTEAAARVHYVDPRVRQLAEAAWRMQTGGSRADWLALGKDNPEALIREGRDWLRAAVAAGIVPAPDAAEPAQSADRVVAYRIDHRPSSLLCREHAEDWAGLTPVTSEDLPDGGICTWHDCGRDVLADS